MEGDGLEGGEIGAGGGLAGASDDAQCANAAVSSACCACWAQCLSFWSLSSIAPRSAAIAFFWKSSGCDGRTLTVCIGIWPVACGESRKICLSRKQS